MRLPRQELLGGHRIRYGDGSAVGALCERQLPGSFAGPHSRPEGCVDLFATELTDAIGERSHSKPLPARARPRCARVGGGSALLRFTHLFC